MLPWIPDPSALSRPRSNEASTWIQYAPCVPLDSRAGRRYLDPMPLLLFVLMLSLLTACERTEPPGAHAGDGTEVDSPGASYGRKLLFLSGSEAEPTAMLFRFTVATESDHVRRSARAWLGRDGGWSDLLEIAWDGPPMRDAWRLVPHGPLRVVADDGGDVEALVHHDDERGFRLLPAAAVTEWSPTELSHFRVRSADLLIGEDPLGGILLDVQAGSLTPAEQTTTTAFLTDGRDLFLVVAAGPGSRSPAWLRLGFREEGFENVVLTPDAEDSTLVYLSEPREQLLGELRLTQSEPTATMIDADSAPALDEAPDPERPGTEPDIAVPLTANGWIEAHGERRPVYGIVQHVQE